MKSFPTILFRKDNVMETAQELALLIEDNQERYYKVAFSYVKNREDALDIIHNAIVKALQSFHKLRNPAYAQTWFYKILTNECISFLRKNRKMIPLEDYQTPHLPPAGDLADIHKDEYIDLYAAIDKLPPDMKTIVILRFFDDMKYDEIAEITSTNLNTIKSRLHRALKHLKLDMEVLEHD